MSIPLDPVDLAGAIVGSTGTVSWAAKMQQMGGGSGPYPYDAQGHLQCYNESGCGLQVTIGGAGHRLVAGAWTVLPIQGSTTSLNYTVEYVLSGQPVSLLLLVLYAPGESVPPVPMLGNSPIGVGGTVQTSTGNALKNDGNAPGTQVVETTPSDQGTSALAINNDGSGNWFILSAGTLRSVLDIIRGNATTTKAQVVLGDSGDSSITTLYGVLAQLSADSGNITSDGAGNITMSGAKVATNVAGGATMAMGWDTAGTGNGFIQSALGGASTHGIYFATWNGSATVHPFSVGANPTGNTYITTSGGFGNLAGQNTAGSFGVPVIVAQALDSHIADTSNHTLVSYVVPAQGLYRVSMYITNGNSVSSTINAHCQWTDPRGGTPTVYFSAQSAGTSPILLSGTNTIGGNQGIATYPVVIEAAAAGNTILVAYQNPSGTPNDYVSAIIERLS